jgi:hypothetical protein
MNFYYPQETHIKYDNGVRERLIFEGVEYSKEE